MAAATRCGRRADADPALNGVGDPWHLTSELFRHDLYYLWEEHKWYRAFRRHGLPWEYEWLFMVTDSHGATHEWGKYGPFFFAPGEETRYDAGYGRPMHFKLKTPGWHEVSWTGLKDRQPCLTGFVPQLPYLIDNYFEDSLAYYNRDFEVIRYVFRQPA